MAMEVHVTSQIRVGSQLTRHFAFVRCCKDQRTCTWSVFRALVGTESFCSLTSWLKAFLMKRIHNRIRFLENKNIS